MEKGLPIPTGTVFTAETTLESPVERDLPLRTDTGLICFGE
jgi:hypothetical protein